MIVVIRVAYRDTSAHTRASIRISIFFFRLIEHGSFLFPVISCVALLFLSERRIDWSQLARIQFTLIILIRVNLRSPSILRSKSSRVLILRIVVIFLLTKRTSINDRLVVQVASIHILHCSRLIKGFIHPVPRRLIRIIEVIVVFVFQRILFDHREI